LILFIHPNFLKIDINNVGSMSQFLYAHNHPNYDDVEASKWQAAQVSTLSLMNCLARIFVGKSLRPLRSSLLLLIRDTTTLGLISDFAKTNYDVPRSYGMTLIAFILLVSQIVAANVTDVSYLWISSLLLGLGYGSASSLLPHVCLEWFGLRMFFLPPSIATKKTDSIKNIFFSHFRRELGLSNRGTDSSWKPLQLHFRAECRCA
jgi:hypothetical protein